MMWKRAGREVLDLALLRGFTRAGGGGQVMMLLGWLSLFGAPLLLVAFVLGWWP